MEIIRDIYGQRVQAYTELHGYKTVIRHLYFWSAVEEPEPFCNMALVEEAVVARKARLRMPCIFK